VEGTGHISISYCVSQSDWSRHKSSTGVNGLHNGTRKALLGGKFVKWRMIPKNWNRQNKSMFSIYEYILSICQFLSCHI